MSSTHRATCNSRFLITFIAGCAIFSQQALIFNSLLVVNAEVDVNVMTANGKSPHSYDASLTSDGQFFDTDQHYLPESDMVENVPAFSSNGNASIGSQTGKLYNYDDYMGSIDMYDYGNYDYGKYFNETAT